MSFVSSMIKTARDLGNRLVLPEGTEPRTVRAARKILDEKIASEVILLGLKADVEKTAAGESISLEGITLVDPTKSAWLDEFSAAYFEKRKHKGITEEQARTDMTHVLRFGAMMVNKGYADSIVAGAEYTTGDVLRAGLTEIGRASCRERV